MAALADAPGLAGIHDLNLSNNHISAAGFRALAGSPYTDNLTRLDVENNRLTNEGARALASSTSLSRLQRLTVGSADMGKVGRRPHPGEASSARLTERVLSKHPSPPTPLPEAERREQVGLRGEHGRLLRLPLSFRGRKEQEEGLLPYRRRPEAEKTPLACRSSWPARMASPSPSIPTPSKAVTSRRNAE